VRKSPADPNVSTLYEDARRSRVNAFLTEASSSTIAI
jgi:hypothetical protein